jgi:hypothetical protein
MNIATFKINPANLLEKIRQGHENNKGLYFVLGISAFLKIFIFLALSETAINNDGLLYISAAQQYAAGSFKAGLGLYPMPLYPLLIAIVHFIIPNWVVAARLISLTFLVLAAIPLYLLIKDNFDTTAAFWGCLAFALAPVPNGWVGEVIREPSFIFVFAWTVYFAQRAINSEGIKYFLLAAIFAWLAVGFRMEGIIFFPFYLLFLIGLAIFYQLERPYFLKGIMIWIGFPLFLFIIFNVFIGLETASFNRMDEVILRVKDFSRFKFFDTYHQIYGYLQTIEHSPPFSGWNQNFAAISRHYMPLIYLFGLLETLIKILFPFFVIPLFWGFRDPLTRSRYFLFGLVIIYLFSVYYYHVTWDFISTRFLFIPAFFLSIWIGRGMERMFALTKEGARPRLYASVFAVLFFLSPVYKSIHSILKQDHVITYTGKWIAAHKAFDSARIATNDPRILFYASRESYDGKKNNFVPYRNLGDNFSGMERLADETLMDVLVIRTSTKRKDMLSGLKHFKKVKEFIGKKKVAVVYCSKEFLSRLGEEDQPL